MRRIVFAWAAAFGILCAGLASAEDPGNADKSSAEAPADPAEPAEEDVEEEELAYSRSGGYLGVGGSFAAELFSATGDQDDGSAITFRGGYRGYSWLAVEFLGEVLPHFDGSDSIDNDVNGYAVTVNAKLVLPLGRFEPFAMAGVGILNIDQDLRNRKDDFAFRGAVGLDFYLTPHWALYGEAAYMLPTGDVSDFAYSTFGGGILFRF